MDELTLGLIGAGAVVVGGVVVYNAWQGAKVRRKMPRPMPADTAESFARDDQEEQSPFIEPARPTTRREPVVGSEAAAETAAAEARSGWLKTFELFWKPSCAVTVRCGLKRYCKLMDAF